MNNHFRTFLLIAAMTGLFLAVGYLIGGQSGMLIAFGLAAAMNLFAYWNSDKMVLRMYGAREVDRNTAPQFYGIVEQRTCSTRLSTMSVLVGGGAEAEPDEGVMDRIRTMTRSDGSLVFTPATAASALIFFVLAMQCLPTLAVTRKETGRIKYAAIQLAYMSSLSYLTALVAYQGLRALGVS